MKYRLVDLIKEGLGIPRSVELVICDCMKEVSMYGIYIVFPDDFCAPVFEGTKVSFSLIAEDRDYAEIIMKER